MLDVFFELHDEQDTFLRAIHNPISPGFNAVLQDDGNATFALLRNDAQVGIISEGHIVHVYVDGRDIFTWVIEEISEAFGESGQDLITYKGRDSRVLLDYALIYPDGWEDLQGDPRQPQYGLNQLFNGNFELDGGTDPAPGWTTYPADFVYTNVVGNGTVSKGMTTGSKSLRMQSYVNRSSTLAAKQTGLFNARQDRSFSADKTRWRIVGTVKSIYGTTANVEASIIFRWFRNDSATELGESRQVATIHDAWDNIDFTVDVDSKATSYSIELWAQGIAVWDWDLMQLMAVYTDALPQYPAAAKSPLTWGPSLVQNGNFGTVYTGVLPQYWQAPADIVPKVTAIAFSTGNTAAAVSAFTFNRAFPDQEGDTIFQDVPVDQGKAYHLRAKLLAHSATAAYVPSAGATWFRRQWQDKDHVNIGTAISDQTRVQKYVYNACTFEYYEFPSRVAPPGAAFVRITLVAPANVVYPVFGDVELKRGVASTSGGNPPGVIKGYEGLRIGEIIDDLITVTGQRKILAKEPWYIAPGVMEYDLAYDILDNVLIPKDQVASVQYRFDYLGAAIRSLALGHGNVRLRSVSAEERAAGKVGLVCDYTISRGTDLTKKITFREAVDVKNIPQKDHSTKDIRTKLIVEGQGNGITVIAVEVKDDSLTQKYKGIREGYLDRKGSTHMIDLRKEGRAAMTDLDLSATNFTIEVSTHIWRPFIDYTLGDSVHISVPRLGVEKNYRIMAMAATFGNGTGMETISLDLDSAAYDAFTTTVKGQQYSVSAIQAIQRRPTGNSVLYQANGDDVLDKEHPYEFVFFVPSTPSYTNQIRLAFQGVKFRSPISITENGRPIPTTGSSLATGPNGAIPGRTIQTSIYGQKDVITTTTAVTGPTTGLPPAWGGAPAPVVTTKTIDYTHSHSVTIPGTDAHTHTIPLAVKYGIFESTAPTNLVASVNGQLLDPLLYEYSDVGGTDLEIGSLIKRGWNTVSFTSDVLGRVIVQVIIQAYLSSTGIE